MIRFPNAKINLGLNITKKRPDGYHNIETIFYPVEWKDALEIVPNKNGKEYEFHQSGLDVSCPEEKNLVLKAYFLFKKHYEIPPVDIFLRKVIPFGAGLGGGSSDAANMLLLLNEWTGLSLSLEKLADMAVLLGADCPFFIYNKPLFATGIGNVFKPVDLSLKGYYIILIKPDVFVSTADAYASVTPTFPKISLTEIIEKPVTEWKKYMKNDFEESVFKKYPLLSDIKTAFYDNGAIYASMSGSGSSVYGIFENKPDWNPVYPKAFLYKGLLI